MAHEIPRRREIGDPSAGRAIPAAGTPHPGETRHSVGDLYRLCDRYSRGRAEALNERRPRPDRVWNRIPDAVRDNVIELALDQPALSPRELTVRFTDSQSYFVSETSVYRLRAT